MSFNTRYENIVNKLTTSDIVNLVGSFGLPETSIRYINGCLIMPTVCHNNVIAGASHKLYYYENSKKFHCYTCCGQMSVFDFIVNAHKARDMKYSVQQAALLLEQIISVRMKQGFAIISEPTELPTEIGPDDNWRATLTEYNEAVLDCFSQNKRYLSIWEKEGISYSSMEKYNIRYDMVRNRMVIPIYDDRKKLVGIKVRNFNQWEIENGRKYMPLIHNNEVYTYEKGKVCYGLSENKSSIRKAKSVIILEAEKGVLLFDSMFTSNRSIGVGGSFVSIYQAQLLKELGVETVVIAFDNDYSKFPDEKGEYDKMFGLKKAIKEANKLDQLGFKVEIVYDWEQELLEDTDSPVDRGRQVYSKLYRDRKTFEELKDTYLKKEEELYDTISPEMF